MRGTRATEEGRKKQEAKSEENRKAWLESREGYMRAKLAQHEMKPAEVGEIDLNRSEEQVRVCDEVIKFALGVIKGEASSLAKAKMSDVILRGLEMRLKQGGTFGLEEGFDLEKLSGEEREGLMAIVKKAKRGG